MNRASNEAWPADLSSRYGAALANLDEPWRADLRGSLDALATADPLFAPTTFWRPGVDAIMDDLAVRGLAEFKRWPSAAFFFYPRYSPALSYAQVDAVMPALTSAAPGVNEAWFRSMLVGAHDANRDVDVVLAQLDRTILPIDVERHGESEHGAPPQRYRPFGSEGPAFGKAHLNYLKILSAASRLMPSSPRTVLEVGGGHGALGEILLTADPTIQYVDVDIPPLATLAHHYLTSCLTRRDLLMSSQVDEGRSVALAGGGPSGCLSSWQLPQLTGTVDLFVNSFSFQEMEPVVVENYVRHVTRLEATTVVSLNSRRGKPVQSGERVGVRTPVTSDFIADAFARHGYTIAGRLGRPTAPPQAECLVMQRVT
jgi:putative sugar O-methyltransferase